MAALRKMSVSHVSGSGGMYGSNGDHPICWNGYRSTDGDVHSSLDMLGAKQDNRRMAQEKNANAQALGSLGGKARAESLSDAEKATIASKGGKARASKLSAVERSRIAKRAVAARELKRKESDRNE